MFELFRRISIPHFARFWIALTAAGMALGFATNTYAEPASSFDQPAHTYREVDTDTGRELRKFTVWRTRNGNAISTWRASRFPNGAQMIEECVKGEESDPKTY